MRKGKVLVSGYGGFLGSSICRQLLSKGYEVHGLARGSYPTLESMGVVCHRGDAANPASVQPLVRGCDAIIHTAAIAGVGGVPKDYEHANVTTTQVLMDAAKSERLAAFVFCSSPSVVFAGKSQSFIDESQPYPDTFLADYPRTKAEAEILVLNEAATIPVCALRPHLIWGAGDNHLIPRLVAKASRGRLRIIGDGKNIIDTVHVDSAASAHIDALEMLLNNPSRINGRAFFITDDQPIACWDWIAMILKRFDLPKPTKSVSLKAAYRIGHALELAYRALRLRGEPPMTRFVALQLGLDHYYNITAAKDLLGYQPLLDRDAKLMEINS